MQVENIMLVLQYLLSRCRTWFIEQNSNLKSNAAMLLSENPLSATTAFFECSNTVTICEQPFCTCRVWTAITTAVLIK